MKNNKGFTIILFAKDLMQGIWKTSHTFIQNLFKVFKCEVFQNETSPCMCTNAITQRLVQKLTDQTHFCVCNACGRKLWEWTHFSITIPFL